MTIPTAQGVAPVGGQPPAPWGLAATCAVRERGGASRRACSVYSQQLYAISGWSSRAYLRRLSVPVLVLAGTHDPLVPVRNARILARELPGARLHLVHGGHLFLLEQPDEGCRAVVEFLDERDLERAGASPSR